MFDVSIRKVLYLYLSDNEAAYCIRTLSDGTAWIGTGNQSVKLVNKDGAVIREHRLDFYPYNIAVTDDGNLLLSKGNSIQKISSDGKVSEFFSSKSHFVQGLCSSRKGEILVCLTRKENGKIVKLSPGGTVSHEIEFDHKGSNLFVNPTKIAENPVTGDICIEDSSQCSIIVVSSHGEHLFTYKGKTGDTFTPFYITCDMHGHILIGDNSHFRIHLLNGRGEFIQYLLSQEDGLFSPWGMDERDGQLWVGTLSGKIWLIEYVIQNDCNY
ncbi:hypothetical protein FSP39_004485 [Pinctada imbricata]|uniref:Uncharacterized protein n=1 Tax=Pinctada imbricata TaxID=66713 RepID=A0AA89BPI7_PINIB|nr:hypothetical protein FSP39_004485 [Pinctada imbricata]